MLSSVRGTIRTVPVSVAYLGVGSLAVLAYFRTPGLSSTERLPFYLLVSLSAAAAIVAGVLRYRPARPLPWILFAASQLVYFAADVTFYTYHDILHDARYPAPADALYLAHYPLLVAGLLLLGARRRNPLLDTLIVGAAFALLTWILLMDPYTHETAGSTLLRATSLAYPVMDLMVLFAALRLAGAGLRVPAVAYLAVALLFLLFSDWVYAWLQVKGKYSGPGDFLDATWLTYYLLLGASALSPSMVRLSDVRPAGPVRLGAGRLLLLTAAAVTPPVAAIVEWESNKTVHVLAVAVASIVLFVLVVARLAGVADAQRRDQAEKERLLGRVVEVAEHERRRVASALNGGPIQKLQALALRLELLASQLSRGELMEASASLRRVRDEVSDEMQALRRLSANLRSPVIDERGLLQAVRESAERLLGPDVAVHLAGPESGGRLPAEIETILYRVAREALLNVNAHAQARRVDVTLAQGESGAVLSIRDDGRGFDAAGYVLDAARFPGLSTMDDLARSVAGSMRVTSGRGAGTEVRVTVPLPRDPDHGRELSQVTSAG